MKGKKGGVFTIFMILILLVALLFVSYYAYQNLPGEPERLSAIISQPKLETGNLSYKVKQFHPNMRFNHNPISYKIDPACSEEKRERMIEAFNELAGKVEIISFYSVNEKPDIEVSCSEETEQIEENYFIAGEGGAKEIIQTGRYNIITDGIVLLYDTDEGVKCGWPNVELHELLHVFGFDHSQDENSLMYPLLESCNQKLDESIINDLKELYSQENLADLYFEEAKAVKRGRYLDFNITVKNSGAVNAENVLLSVFDEDKKIEDFDLGNMSFGGGLAFYVSDLKLKSRGSSNIKLTIDAENLIKEIDEGNNIARLAFG